MKLLHIQREILILANETKQKPRLPAPVLIASVVDGLLAAGLLEREADDCVAITSYGRAALDEVPLETLAADRALLGLGVHGEDLP